jgi:NADPH-dependent curcumin reductase CurA
MTLNHRIVLASRPTGEAELSHFQFEQQTLPDLRAGEVLVRHHFLSLDPYMRGRMNAGKSYIEPQPLGEVMGGGTVGEVLASRHPHYAVGDQVVGMGGWQEYAIVQGDERGSLRKVDTTHIPLSAYLGAVGMPGVTAWYGMFKIIQPQAGETVVISAASGAVGAVAGQLARSRGARVVGIAGGPEKCQYLLDELGFDACIDYKAHGSTAALSKALKAACPQGVDGYFENVGGIITDAVFSRCNPFARVAVCGMIAGYDGQPIPLAAPQLILINRMRIEGFIVSEHMADWPEALHTLGTAVATGQLKFRESVAQGLAAAPQAFLGMLKGHNFGKQLVKLV